MTIQELLASDPSVSPAFSCLFGNPAPTAIDLEDTERRLSRAFDLINSEVPGTHFRNLQMRRKTGSARDGGGAGDRGRGMTGITKIGNEYARAFGELYAKTPKAVFAAVAYSYATWACGTEAKTSDEAVARFLSEWRTLQENGIVPQKPPSLAQGGRLADAAGNNKDQA